MIIVFGEKMLNFLEKHLGGHLNLGPVTIFGFNAMFCAINISTKRWGHVCFRPQVWYIGTRVMGWYFYVSPNGTPWASTFAIGPGVRREDKRTAKIRRKKYGHNFDTEAVDLKSMPEGGWL